MTPAQDTVTLRSHAATLPPEMLSGFAWTRKRLYLYACTAFFMLVIAYILHNRLDTRIAETIAETSIWAISGLAGSYLFGSVWQNNAITKKLGS